MHGPGVNDGNTDIHVLGRPHCSDPNLYIFVAYHDTGYKMTAVSLDNAKASTEPSTHVDKFIESSSDDILVYDKWCEMWDGNGHTAEAQASDRYELKDVRVSGCGLYIHICPYMRVTHACYYIPSAQSYQHIPEYMGFMHAFESIDVTQSFVC